MKKVLDRLKVEEPGKSQSQTGWFGPPKNTQFPPSMPTFFLLHTIAHLHPSSPSSSSSHRQIGPKGLLHHSSGPSGSRPVSRIVDHHSKLPETSGWSNGRAWCVHAYAYLRAEGYFRELDHSYFGIICDSPRFQSTVTSYKQREPRLSRTTIPHVYMIPLHAIARMRATVLDLPHTALLLP